MLLQKHNAPDAAAAFRDVLKVDAENPDAHAGLARVAIVDRYDGAAALEEIARALAVNPAHAEALALRAQLALDSEDWAAATIPAANGIFTARSLARLYAMLAGGGELDGVRLLSRETVERATLVQNRGIGRVVPYPMHWRLGYHRVPTLGTSLQNAFGHFGFGGSGPFCDPDRELAVAMTVNHGTVLNCAKPGRSRWPMGFCPFQNVLTSDSLTMTTIPDEAASLRWNERPCTIGTPIVSK